MGSTELAANLFRATQTEEKLKRDNTQGKTKANNLDAKNEKSWIVFAESANKLGKKEEAVSALENYIRSSQSDTAKNALSKIKNHE